MLVERHDRAAGRVRRQGADALGADLGVGDRPSHGQARAAPPVFGILLGARAGREFRFIGLRRRSKAGAGEIVHPRSDAFSAPIDPDYEPHLSIPSR